MRSFFILILGTVFCLATPALASSYTSVKQEFKRASAPNISEVLGGWSARCYDNFDSNDKVYGALVVFKYMDTVMPDGSIFRTLNFDISEKNGLADYFDSHAEDDVFKVFDIEVFKSAVVGFDNNMLYSVNQNSTHISYARMSSNLPMFHYRDTLSSSGDRGYSFICKAHKKLW